MADQLMHAVDRNREIDRSQALLLDPKQSAAFIGVSLRKFYELRSHGKLPPPVRLGERIVRHRRADLIAFVEQLDAAAEIPEPGQLAAGKRRRIAVMA